MQRKNIFFQKKKNRKVLPIGVLQPLGGDVVERIQQQVDIYRDRGPFPVLG